jgi:hypothetical protein
MVQFVFRFVLMCYLIRDSARAAEQMRAFSYPQHGLKLELPAIWNEMPPAMKDQIQSYVRDRLARGPLKNVAFNTAFLRGENAVFSLLAGEYLILTFSPNSRSRKQWRACFPKRARSWREKERICGAMQSKTSRSINSRMIRGMACSSAPEPQSTSTDRCSK